VPVAGYAFSVSGGVSLKSKLGINLSLSDNYSSRRAFRRSSRHLLDMVGARGDKASRSIWIYALASPAAPVVRA